MREAGVGEDWEALREGQGRRGKEEGGRGQERRRERGREENKLNPHRYNTNQNEDQKIKIN